MKKLALFLLLLASPCFASRLLTDELGRKVTVPDHPHRLICLAPSIVDDVYQLGAGVDIIAVSDFTKYPAEAASKPSVGLPLSPSMEKIISMHPDLILAMGELNQIERLRPIDNQGIPIFMVDPRGLKGVYSSIESLGKALNREGAAQQLIGKLHAREQAVRLRAQGKPQVRIFMPVWHDPVITIGRGDYITELIEIAGGKSVTDDIAQAWPHVSLEAVIARNPDALLLVRNGKMSLQNLAGRPGWNSLRAVQAGRVYYVDDRIELASPIAFDALEDLSKQFHP
jgi:iron complex transport system substrate-binding protein